MSSGTVSVTTAGTRISRPKLEGLADDTGQLVQVDRLEQVVEGPLPDGLDGRFGGRRRRDEHDGRPRVELVNLAKDVESREIGQPQVEQHDVGTQRLELPQPVRTVLATVAISTPCGAKTCSSWSKISVGSSSIKQQASHRRGPGEYPSRTTPGVKQSVSVGSIL